MHRLRGIASDVHEEHTADGVVFAARLPAAEAGRYARFVLEPEVEPADAADQAQDDAGTSVPRMTRKTGSRSLLRPF